ncbi:hypothetical protein [Dactylosporangium sp. NPDC051541]|uniref:hypothetical protein n=1 Tax=Dactylosporangium sp. NPDC051541 TaxID=3363977 RepID=UPI0037978DA6
MTDEAMRVLAEQAVPPSRLQAEGVLAVARSSARRRRLVAVMAAGALSAVALTGTAVAVSAGDGAGPPVVAGPATSGHPSKGGSTEASPPGPPPATVAPPNCTSAALAAPATAGPLTVDAIDPGGRYVVGLVEAGAEQRLVVWTDGTPATPGGGRNFSPHDVNATGVIAGAELADGGKSRAAVFSNGKLTRLPLPAGATASNAVGINARGDVVGDADFPGDRIKAVLWRAGASTPVVLAGGSQWATANGIADDGTVVGTLDDGGQPYTWDPSGTGHALPQPAAPDPGGKAWDVSGDWIVGWAGRTGTQPQPVRWNRRTGAVEAMPGLLAHEISATGVAVGVTSDLPGGPALWHNGVATLTGPGGGNGGELVDVSADGRTIIGNGGNGPAIWHC